MPQSMTYLWHLIEPGRLRLFPSRQIVPLGNLPLQSWKDERNIVKNDLKTTLYFLKLKIR